MPDTTNFKIIRGGYVLDNDTHQAEPTDVLIEGNRIAALMPPGAAVPEGTQPIDAYDRLLVPGLINAHTHSHGGLAKGMGDRWTLELLLHASPWLSGSRTLEHLYLSSLIGALEMVRKGCTACYDLFLELPVPTPEGLDAIARAYQEAGMRAVVAPMTADRTFYQAIPGLLDALPATLRLDLEKTQMQPGGIIVDACRTLLKQTTWDTSRLRLALAPTIPLHCSDDFLIAHRELAQEYGVGIHMHLDALDAI